MKLFRALKKWNILMPVEYKKSSMYELVMNDDTYHKDHWCVKILEGELEGLVYQYDTVAFNEDESGQGYLDFNILMVENPKEKDFTSAPATVILGNILCEIVEDNLRESTDGDGNSNTETPAE